MKNLLKTLVKNTLLTVVIVIGITAFFILALRLSNLMDGLGF